MKTKCRKNYFYGMNLIIKHVSEDDYILVADLAAETFYETWRPVNTEEDMQEYLASSFNYEKINKELADNAVNTYLVAFDGDAPVGYAKLRRDRTYEEFKNERAIEIERIYVKKEWQDKKAGKALMDGCISISNAENYQWLWLGVNVDNLKAINFYRRYGFEIFGEKSFRLGNADDTDYLMKLKLPG